jgi:hypothetical protein
MSLHLGGATRDQIKFARRCARALFYIDNLVELAQWAAANAFGKPDSEWLSIGQELK